MVIVWVALSTFGLILSLYLTLQSWRDLVAMGSDANGRHWAALSRFAREGLRVTVHWAWLLLGVSVLLGIQHDPLHVGALLYGNAVLVTNSLIDARSRSLLYKHRANDALDIELRKADAAERTADATEKIAENQ